MSKETIISNEFLKLEVSMLLNVPYIHAEIYKWTPTLYKAYKQVWNKFLSQMGKEGHPCVFCVIPDNDSKLLKFEKMFGFEEVKREDGQILMVKDT